MKIYIIIIFILCMACQGKKQDPEKTKAAVKEVEAVAVIEDIICNAEVCLQLRNHDVASKSFEIYMLNSIPVAGFQCDFPGINIIGSDGLLVARIHIRNLKEWEHAVPITEFRTGRNNRVSKS